MLTAKNLERIMELEDKLRAEYQEQLDAKTAEIDRCNKQQEEQRQQLQATIDTQLGTITELSEKAAANQQVEQLNRELSNQTEKLRDKVSTLKKRVKALQADLSEAREQISSLTQYDAARMKKNLDANKKKLAEKTRANDLLQRTMNATKAENAELQGKLRELESKLAKVDTTESAATESAATESTESAEEEAAA